MVRAMRADEAAWQKESGIKSNLVRWFRWDGEKLQRIRNPMQVSNHSVPGEPENENCAIKARARKVRAEENMQQLSNECINQGIHRNRLPNGARASQAMNKICIFYWDDKWRLFFLVCFTVL